MLWLPGRGSPDPPQGFNSCFPTKALPNKAAGLNTPSHLDKVLSH